MKIFLIIYFLIFSFSAHALKSQKSLDFFYGKWLCVQEQATGFIWKNNKWKKTDFKPLKYIVEMVPIQNNCIGEYESSKYYERFCANIWQFGGEPFFETPSYSTFFKHNNGATTSVTDTFQYKMRITDKGDFTMHKSSPGNPSTERGLLPDQDQWVVSTGKCEKL